MHKDVEELEDKFNEDENRDVQYSTPLMKKNAIEISRIPLQEALKNGNGNQFIKSMVINFSCFLVS